MTLTRAPLRVIGPSALLTALPRMLGYHPRDSIVLVALRGPRGKLAVTMRLDLPERGDEAECADLLALGALQNRADRAVLLRYDETAAHHVGIVSTATAAVAPATAGARVACTDQRSFDAVPPIVAAVRDALHQRDIGLTDALLVAAGRWWSDLCLNPRCCPAEGTPLPLDETSVVTAALVAEGARALPDRDAVVRSIAAPRSARRVEAERALDAAAAELADRVAAGESHHDLRQETRALFDETLAGYPQGRGLAPATAARLVVGLGDVGARDSVLARAARPDSDALLSLLMDLVRTAIPPVDAPVATALAWVAYSRGDGTLANVALDRALLTDPGYSMARLIREGLDRAIDPRQVREISAACDGEP